MADLRSSTTVLEDSGTQAGLPLHKALAGETSVAKNAHGALVATDGANAFQYMKVNANRELIVSSESADLAYLFDEGGVVGSTSFQTLAEITLAADTVYRSLDFNGSCFRDAVYEVVFIADAAGTPVETVLVTFRTGAGELSFGDSKASLEFTSGGTGDQLLRIRAKQLQNAASDIDGMVAIKEVQA